MVGSAGTSRPAARRSQACRRACPAHDAGDRGAPAATPRPARQQPASRSAVRVPYAGGTQRRWAVVKDVGVRPPNDGQAAADDARPRPPEDATPAAVHVVRVDPQRLVHAPYPHLPPLRRRLRLRRLAREAVQRLAARPGTSPPPGLQAPGPRPAQCVQSSESIRAYNSKPTKLALQTMPSEQPPAQCGTGGWRALGRTNQRSMLPAWRCGARWDLPPRHRTRRRRVRDTSENAGLLS